MRPPKQKQPQVKRGLCRVLEHVDVLVGEINLKVGKKEEKVQTSRLCAISSPESAFLLVSTW